MLERLVGELYEERSRKGIGEFPITQRIQGYWDRNDTEIDLVALNEPEGRIRFGSCKRSPQKLVADINNFKGHVERFLEAFPKYRKWNIELCGISPRLDAATRTTLAQYSVQAQDLIDLTAEL